MEFQHTLQGIQEEKLQMLYGVETSRMPLFEKSRVSVFAWENGQLKGAVRAISEGVETALMVDLCCADGSERLQEALIREAEEELRGRRVMVWGSLEQMALLEHLGYGRCKNAWTYFRDGMPSRDFLPQGFRYEHECRPEMPRCGTTEKRQSAVVFRFNDPADDFGEINGLLSKAFGGRPHDRKRTETAFRNSDLRISARAEGRMVGIARAVSDGGEYGTILNVAVDPAFQGLNIGRRLVLGLAENLSVRTIVLNTHPGAAGFYNSISAFRRNRYVFEKMIPDGEEQALPKDSSWRDAMFTAAGYRFPDEY